MQRQLTVSVMETEEGHVTVLLTKAVMRHGEWSDTAIETTSVDVKMPEGPLAWDSRAVRIIRDEVLGCGGLGEALRTKVAKGVSRG